MSSYRSVVWECTYLSRYVVIESWVPCACIPRQCLALEHIWAAISHSIHCASNIYVHYVHVFFLTVVDCGTLTDPANGLVSHTAGTTFGQIATYSCDTGYNLVGDSNHTCRATGVWSGCAPTCQGMLLLEIEYYLTWYCKECSTQVFWNWKKCLVHIVCTCAKSLGNLHAKPLH